MKSMKAVVIHQFGGPEILKFEEVPIPEPKEDEVLVKVCAASVNPIDYKVRSGAFPSKAAFPILLGRDLSGVVAARGRGARVKEGDAIFALLGRGRGSYAQYAIVKTNEFAAKPPGLSHPEAAAVPLAGLTAWQGLFDHGGLEQGQRVLVHGGAGGVGHLAIQFAAARGAFVTATVSDDDLIFARNLGAEQVIDYRHDRFEAQVEKVDLVFDLVDGEIQDRSFAVLKPGGRLISTLKQPDEDKLRQYHVRGTNYMTQPNGAQLAAIAELIEQGKVRVEVSAIYPFEQAAEAQRHLENCHVRGKIAIVMPS